MQSCLHPGPASDYICVGGCGSCNCGALGREVVWWCVWLYHGLQQYLKTTSCGQWRLSELGFIWVLYMMQAGFPSRLACWLAVLLVLSVALSASDNGAENRLCTAGEPTCFSSCRRSCKLGANPGKASRVCARLLRARVCACVWSVVGCLTFDWVCGCCG